MTYFAPRYDRLRLVRTPVGLVGAIKEAVIKHWSVLVIITIIVIRFTDSDHTIIISDHNDRNQIHNYFPI